MDGHDDLVESTDPEISGLDELLDFGEAPPTEEEPPSGEGEAPEGEAPEEVIPPKEEALPNQREDLKYISLLEERLKALEAQIKPVEAPPEAVPEDPLDGIDFDEAMTSRETFAKVLQRVADRVREKVLAEVSPALTFVEARQKQEASTAADLFYQENPDLKGYNRAVVAAVQEVLAGNPQSPQGEVLKKAATIVRESLGLPKRSAPQKPSLAPPQKGVRTPVKAKPELTKTQEQVLDLINF